VANLKLAQVFQTSLSAVYDQFKTSGSYPSLLVNKSLGLSLEEFKELMTGRDVPFSSPDGLDYYTFTEDEWNNFTAEEWYHFLGSPSYLPSKASIYLNLAGQNQGHFVVEETLVVDASNHAGLKTSTDSGFLLSPGTGGGSMESIFGGSSLDIFENQGFVENESSWIRYPLQFKDDSVYTINLRLKAKASHGGSSRLGFSVALDDHLVYEHSESVVGDTWIWRNFTIVVPDPEIHDFKITPTTPEISIDKIVISKDDTIPTGEGPEADLSPFVTVHSQVYSINDETGEPENQMPVYDARNTLGDVLDEGWYNFDLTPVLSGGSYSETSEFALVVSVSGGNNNHFVSWDTSVASENMPSLSWNGVSWEEDSTKNYACLIYSNQVAVNEECAVSVRPAQQLELKVTDFRKEDAVLVNTAIEESEYNENFGKIVLDLPASEVTFVVDHSGSMTWNDPEGVRFDLIDRVSKRINASQGGNAKFNLVKFGGSKILPFLFTSPVDYRGDDPQEILKQHLQNSNSPIVGYRLVRRSDSFPESPIDGDIVSDGVFSKIRDTDVIEGTQYFYKLYSYDSNNNFSQGLEFSFTPNSDGHPIGVGNLTASVLLGTGVSNDGNVVSSWHFDEGDGDNAFDFGNDQVSLSVPKESRWLDQTNVPVGRSGIRLDGIEGIRSNSGLSTSGGLGDKMTLAAWVYWYGDEGTIISRESSSSTNYILSISSSGNINFRCAASPFSSSTGTIPSNEWCHVCVTVDLSLSESHFYINGDLDSQKPLASTTDSSSAMQIVVGDNFAGTSTFFGRITEVSVHDVVRNEDWITEAATPKDGEQDNGDRVVIAKWLADQDSGSKAVVTLHEVKDDLPILSSESGNHKNIVNQSQGWNCAQVGQGLRAGKTWDVRVFSREGNVDSQVQDTPAVEVNIPLVGPDIFKPDPEPDLAPVSAFSAVKVPGAAKLSWLMPEDARATSVRIYRDANDYPIISEHGVVGSLVGSFDRTVSEHEVKISGDVYFTIVTTDNFGNISSSKYAFLSSIGGEAVTRPRNPTNVTVSSQNGESVEVSFNIDNLLPTENEFYFGDRVFLYGLVLDEYGNVLRLLDGLNLSRQTEASIQSDSAFYDVSDIETPDADRFVQVNGSFGENGFLRGGVRFSTVSNLLFRTDLVDTKIYLSYLPSDFDENEDEPDNFIIASTEVKFINPLQVNVEIVAEEDFYARRQAPVHVRATTTFRGQPLASARLQTRRIDNYRGYETFTFGGNDDSIWGPVQSKVSDSEINDFFLSSTDTPASTEFHVYADAAGFNKQKIIRFDFLNPLQVDVVAKAPLNNGIDVQEQTALVYMVNPDDPDITTPVPDLTPVRWSLSEKTGASNNIINEQPFYSTETGIRIQNGVYSYVRDGVAKKVFVGPITNLSQSSQLVGNLEASVVFDSLSANGQDDLHVKRYLPGEDDDDFQGPQIQPVFLAEFDEEVKEIWADGKAFAKMSIIHDASVTSSNFSECFLECSNAMDLETVSLTPGSIITISVPHNDVEIIWGDVEEINDSEGSYLDTSNATVAKRTASVVLSEGETTNVWFRANTTDFAPRSSSGLRRSCSCLPYDKDDTGVPIYLSTTLTINNELKVARAGGGSVEGIPPTILRLNDPLGFRFADLRVDGQPSSTFVANGTSTNEFVFEATWRGSSLPPRNKVFIENANSGSLAPIEIINEQEFLRAGIDVLINAGGPLRSFATIKAKPISSSGSFESTFQAHMSYDESGSVTRLKNILVSISYSSFVDAAQVANSTIYGKSHRYDVNSDSWSLLGDLVTPRSGHIMAHDSLNDELFVVGGSSGKIVLSSSETFSGGTWSETSSMSFARSYALSAVSGDKLYVIGGISFSPVSNSFFISAAVESYDFATRTWEVLSPMPSLNILNENVPYGVAMGNTVVSGGKIYVLSGISSISYDVELKRYIVDRFNDRVLVYDIANDEWSASSQVDFPAFERLGALHFNESGNVKVLGGIYDNSALDRVSEFADIPYEIDLTAGSADDVAASLDFADDEFKSLNHQLYKSSHVQFGSNLFAFGGSSPDFPHIDDSFKIDLSGMNYPHGSISDLPIGLHSSSSTSDGSFIYLSGGVSSGRPDEFVQLSLYTNGELVQDGIDTHTFGLSAFDVSGNNLDGTEIEVKGGTDQNDNAYVRFNRTSLPLSGDVSTFVILPRSSDTTGKIGFVSLDSRVDDPSYYGFLEKSRNDVLDNFSEIGINGDSVSLVATRSLPESDGVIIPNSDTRHSPFDLSPAVLPQGISQNVPFSNVVLNLPLAETVLTGGTSSLSELQEALLSIQRDIAFGPSPLYDAIDLATKDLQREGGTEDLRKSIYLLTDGIESGSFVDTDELRKDLISLENGRPAPLVAIDLSLTETPYENSTGRGSGDYSIESLSEQTGGQSMAVVSTSDMDALIDRITGRLVGSTGFGSFTYRIDLHQICKIESISIDFTLPSNSSANWTYAVSNEGFSFEYSDETFDAGDEVILKDVSSKVILIDANMKSPLTTASDDDLSPADVPSLNSITITFDRVHKEHIILGPDTSAGAAEDVAFAAITDEPFGSELKVGISNGVDTDWEYFDLSSSPSRDADGRIVLPNRLFDPQGKEYTGEPLDDVDGYVYLSRYGAWNPSLDVTIWKFKGVKGSSLTNRTVDDYEVVEEDLYSIKPSIGAVVFNTITEDELWIEVSDSSRLSVAVLTTSRHASSSVNLKSLAVMHSTR
jgi:hypothetical protein